MAQLRQISQNDNESFSSNADDNTGGFESTADVEKVETAPRTTDDNLGFETTVDVERVKITPAVPPPPPNGGFVAWLQVAGAFFLFFNSWGIITTFGVFQTYYQETLLPNYSSSTISWIGTIQGCLILLMGAVIGPVFDKGYLRSLLAAGSFLVVFGLMMTSISTEYYQVFLAHGLAVGLGCGFLFLPSVAILPGYFTTKRALATGITASGGSIGSVIYPIMFHRLVGPLGFGWTTRIVGFVALAGLVFSGAVMKLRLPPSGQARSLFDSTALKDMSFIFITLAVFLGFIGLYFPFFYLPAFFTSSLHTDENIAFYTIAILNAASVFGRITPGLVADRIGSLNTVIPIGVLTFFMAYVWTGIHNEAGAIVFAVIYGYTSGAFVSLPPTIIARFTSDINRIGTRMGMSFTLAGVGVLIGNPIAGTMIDLEHAVFWKAQVFAATMVAAGTASYIFVRLLHLKNPWKM